MLVSDCISKSSDQSFHVIFKEFLDDTNKGLFENT